MNLLFFCRLGAYSQSNMRFGPEGLTLLLVGKQLLEHLLDAHVSSLFVKIAAEKATEVVSSISDLFYSADY
jgi:hypothetical protein